MTTLMKPLTRLYYKGSQLCMDIPKQYLFHKNRNQYLGEFVKDYMNVYVKTSFIESSLSSSHTLNTFILQEIELKQVMNIPVQDYITISSDMDCKMTEIFDNISSEYYYDNKHKITRENQQIHLTMLNDTHEMYGYTRQLFDISFIKK